MHRIQYRIKLSADKQFICCKSLPYQHFKATDCLRNASTFASNMKLRAQRIGNNINHFFNGSAKREL
jgi:hypothetical protein